MVRRLIGLERSCFAQPDNDSILPGLTTIVIERFVSKINVSSRKPVDRRAEGEKGGRRVVGSKMEKKSSSTARLWSDAASGGGSGGYFNRVNSVDASCVTPTLTRCPVSLASADSKQLFVPPQLAPQKLTFAKVEIIHPCHF